MIRFLRLFKAFTDLETLAEGQAGNLEAVEEALKSEVNTHQETLRELGRSNQSFELERSKRIAAESIASERRDEIYRLLELNKELRTELARVNIERLRSVDALNLKLMEGRAAEIPPDMTKFKAAEKAGFDGSIVGRVRRQHREMDMNILRGLHPDFKPRRSVTMNEPMPEEAVA